MILNVAILFIFYSFCFYLFYSFLLFEECLHTIFKASKWCMICQIRQFPKSHSYFLVCVFHKPMSFVFGYNKFYPGILKLCFKFSSVPEYPFPSEGHFFLLFILVILPCAGVFTPFGDLGITHCPFIFNTKEIMLLMLCSLWKASCGVEPKPWVSVGRKGALLSAPNVRC